MIRVILGVKYFYIYPHQLSNVNTGSVPYLQFTPTYLHPEMIILDLSYFEEIKAVMKHY
ncbi:MAG: hypothetical protein A4E72_01512 [Syntrophus sp. PtaU1.Bin208]|nr:MAG: hypothetical protein A4E72_01512 [Syntrophus sp. PtaU1.Bin208]